MKIPVALDGYKKLFWIVFLFPFAAVLITVSAYAQDKPFQGNAILLTVFLKHDQSKTLDEIQTQLRKNGFYKNFPPKGVEVVSWYVMMGVGQVVTLRVPAEKLREVNLAVEQSAWGAFRTEFYPTYDYKPIWENERKKAPGK